MEPLSLNQQKTVCVAVVVHVKTH